MPTIAMCSQWRNDSARQLGHRAVHLLTKIGVSRWLWAVGDSSDETEADLRSVAAMWPHKRIEIIRRDTGLVGNDPPTRRRRLSAGANALFEQIGPEDDFVLWQESDLVSPLDVALILLEHARLGRCPVAGWPVLPMGGVELFYDIWAYRKDGVMFMNRPPFHACYRANAPFEVDSFGSMWLMDAAEARDGVHCDEMAVVGLCRQLKERGRRLWVDPGLRIVQPVGLWEPHLITEGA